MILITAWEECGKKPDQEPEESELYAKQYQNCKCIDWGHGNDQDKNFESILKIETRYLEWGKRNS